MLKPRRPVLQETRNPRRASGFTMIEVLVAMGLLLTAIVGLLPLFSRSVVENLEGKESTEVGNHGRSQLEDLGQRSFNNWELEVAAGTERSDQRFYSIGLQDQVGDESWVTAVPGGEIAPWTRTTIVRQLGINGLRDNDLDGVIDEILGLEDGNYDGDFDNALAAGTLPGAIHLKQIEIQVQGEKEWAMAGGASQLTVEGLKAF